MVHFVFSHYGPCGWGGGGGYPPPPVVYGHSNSSGGGGGWIWGPGKPQPSENFGTNLKTENFPRRNNPPLYLLSRKAAPDNPKPQNDSSQSHAKKPPPPPQKIFFAPTVWQVKYNIYYPVVWQCVLGVVLYRQRPPPRQDSLTTQQMGPRITGGPLPTAPRQCGSALQESRCPLPPGGVAVYCRNCSAHCPEAVRQCWDVYLDLGICDQRLQWDATATP